MFCRVLNLRMLVVAASLLTAGAFVAGATAAPPPSPDDITVRFATRIAFGSDKALPLVFDANYAGPGSTARFRISLTNERVVLSAVPGSDARSFLVALRRALHATHVPKAVRRVKRLSLDVAILGYKPATGLIRSKLFFRNDTGETYLNLNLKTGFGEFSLKDEEYGDVVIAELAKVV